MSQDTSVGPSPSPPSNRITVLDGFRGYAILGVVLIHLIIVSGVLSRFEGTNVNVAIWGLFGNTIDAFFIISAFVLFLPAVRRGGDLGGVVNFWVARGARLLPAYLLTIVLLLLVSLVLPPNSGYVYPSLAEIAGHLTMVQMPAHFIDLEFRIGFGINGPMWLISVVVTFYLLLPLIARPYFRHPLVGLLAAAAITVGWKLLLDQRPDLLDPFTNLPGGYIQLFGIDQFPSWSFSFGLGMTGAWAYIQATERWTRAQLIRFATIALAPLSLAIAAAAIVRGGHALTESGYVSQYSRMFALETMIDSLLRAALIGVVAVGPVWMAKPFDNRLTARLAELSYGVYLFHFVLIVYAASYLGLPQDGTLQALMVWTVVVLPASLLLAALSRRFVEIPVLGRARGWLKTRQPS